MIKKGKKDGLSWGANICNRGKGKGKNGLTNEVGGVFVFNPFDGGLYAIAQNDKEIKANEPDGGDLKGCLERLKKTPLGGFHTHPSGGNSAGSPKDQRSFGRARRRNPSLPAGYPGVQVVIYPTSRMTGRVVFVGVGKVEYRGTGK